MDIFWNYTMYLKNKHIQKPLCDAVILFQTLMNPAENFARRY